MSTRVRTSGSGTTEESAGGSDSNSVIRHLGMMTAATTMKMIAHTNVLSNYGRQPSLAGSPTVPGCLSRAR